MIYRNINKFPNIWNFYKENWYLNDWLRDELISIINQQNKALSLEESIKYLYDLWINANTVALNNYIEKWRLKPIYALSKMPRFDKKELTDLAILKKLAGKESLTNKIYSLDKVQKVTNIPIEEIIERCDNQNSKSILKNWWNINLHIIAVNKLIKEKLWYYTIDDFTKETWSMAKPDDLYHNIREKYPNYIVNITEFDRRKYIKSELISEVKKRENLWLTFKECEEYLKNTETCLSAIFIERHSNPRKNPETAKILRRSKITKLNWALQIKKSDLNKFILYYKKQKEIKKNNYIEATDYEDSNLTYKPDYFWDNRGFVDKLSIDPEIKLLQDEDNLFENKRLLEIINDRATLTKSLYEAWNEEEFDKLVKLLEQKTWKNLSISIKNHLAVLVKRRKEKTIKIIEIISELKGVWINNTIELLSYWTRSFRNKFWIGILNTILEITNNDVTIESLKQLWKILWRDIIEDAKKHFYDKTKNEKIVVSDMMSLIKYGQKNFVAKFGFKILWWINWDTSERGAREDIMKMGEKLWWNLKNEVKYYLAKLDINNWFDLLKYDGQKLYNIKEFIWILIWQTIISSVAINEKLLLCNVFWWNIGNDIANDLKENLEAGLNTNESIKALWIGKNKVIEKIYNYRQDIKNVLWRDIIEELASEMREKLKKSFNVYDYNWILEMRCKDLAKLWFQNIWLIIWKSIDDITNREKIEIWKKLFK